MLIFSSGAWWQAARTSVPSAPEPVFGQMVGTGLSVETGTVAAVGMIGRGSMNGLVAGLAVWLPGTHKLNDPGL